MVVLAGRRFAPIVLIVVEVLVANRRDHIGTVDGLARLDDAPCDDGAACAGWAVSLDDEGVAVNCRSVDESLLGEQFAQGPGGRGFRLAGFDTDVAWALTRSTVTQARSSPAVAPPTRVPPSTTAESRNVPGTLRDAYGRDCDA